MQKIVIDTNIVISAAISANGKPAQILKKISDGELKLCYNEQILNEYSNVLSRDKFSFSSEKQSLALDEIVKVGEVFEPKTSTLPLDDEDDRIFYDTAKEAGAILITGNTKHFPTESFIMTPSEFLSSPYTNSKQYPLP